MRGKVMLAAVGVLVAVALSACGGERVDRAPTTPQSNEQIQAMAANMLAAYNSGDYRAFSRDLSLPARLIVDEQTFADEPRAAPSRRLVGTALGVTELDRPRARRAHYQRRER